MIAPVARPGYRTRGLQRAPAQAHAGDVSVRRITHTVAQAQAGDVSVRRITHTVAQAQAGDVSVRRLPHTVAIIARRLRRAAAMGALCLALTALPAPIAPLMAQSATGTPQSLPESDLTIATATGTHSFRVMVADDPAERATGLMFREDMTIEEGMLFVFPREGPRSFWMMNTPLSLDIIFIDAGGRVVNVAKRTTPFSLDGVPSTGDAQFVLELRGGVSDLIRLAPGDKVSHPAIDG